MTNEQIKQFLESLGCEVISVKEYNAVNGRDGVIHIQFSPTHHIPLYRCEMPAFQDRLTIAAKRIADWQKTNG